MEHSSAGGAARTWRPWTIVLPAVAGLVLSAILVLADLVNVVMGSWDTPMPGLGWLEAAAVAHGVLAGASVGVLAAGVARPARRRAAVIGAWLIIGADIGVLLVSAWVAGG